MSEELNDILGWFMDGDASDELMTVKVEVIHPNGRHQIINANIMLKEDGKDISDEMMLRFVNHLGRITDRLKKNQKYILVERDEEV